MAHRMDTDGHREVELLIDGKLQGSLLVGGTDSGWNLREIKRRTGAELVICNSRATFDGSVPLVISGRSAEQVERAKELALQMVGQYSLRRLPTLDEMGRQKSGCQRYCPETPKAASRKTELAIATTCINDLHANCVSIEAMKYVVEGMAATISQLRQSARDSPR